MHRYERNCRQQILYFPGSFGLINCLKLIRLSLPRFRISTFQHIKALDASLASPSKLVYQSPSINQMALRENLYVIECNLSNYLLLYHWLLRKRPNYPTPTLVELKWLVQHTRQRDDSKIL